MRKIRFKNGIVETFSSTEKKTINKSPKSHQSNKTEFSAEDKATIEKIVEKSGLKIAKCALQSLQNCSSSVDWALTRRDIFNPGAIIITMKVNYDQTLYTDTESFVVSLVLNETTKIITWKLLNSTNDSDGIKILRCQKN